MVRILLIAMLGLALSVPQGLMMGDAYSKSDTGGATALKVEYWHAFSALWGAAWKVQLTSARRKPYPLSGSHELTPMSDNRHKAYIGVTLVLPQHL